MATDYFEIPGLSARIAIADAVVIGKFGQLIGLEPDATEGVQRVRGLFEFEIHQWLKGEMATSLALVRLLGEGDDERARWLVPVGDDRRFLLLLGRDVQPGLPEGTFAPIYSSAFDVDDSDEVEIPQDILDEQLRHIARSGRSRIPLASLRNLVQSAIEQRESTQGRMSELLGNDSRGHLTGNEVPEEGGFTTVLGQLTVRARLMVLSQSEDQPSGMPSIDAG